ncbi:MAG: DNA primase, partial [Planctomycetes bacterium]|nr:DNA primase [Planctomycetota bacterium]
MQTRESITEEIRAASDIAGVIGQFVSLKPVGQGFRGLCPFHREKTPSFYVRPAEQYFKCFGCGKAGDVFTFIMEHDSVSFPEARQILADRAGIEIKPASGGSSAKPGIGRRDLFRANQWAMDLFRRELLGAAGGAAREYVASRKISDAMAEKFMVGLAPDSHDFLRSRARRSGVPDDLLVAAGLIKRADDGDHYDTFRHRLIFPIVDPTERIVGFGGRALGDQSAKYINSPETAVFHKSQCLYGMNHARSALKDRGRAVLVEGYTDVIMAHQHGFTETVAPLGTSLTE